MSATPLLTTLIIGGLCLALGPGGSAQGQTLSPQAAYNHARATNRLPPWANPGDDYHLEFSLNQWRVYLCVRDRQTGARWTTWGSFESWAEWLTTGHWTFGAPVPTTYQDQRHCWPDLPEQQP